MSVSAAFTPTGNTVTFTANVSGSVPTPVLVQTSGGLGSNQYRIINASTSVIAHLAVGTSAAAATTNAVIATAGTPSPGIPLLPGTDEILTLPPNAYFTAITSSSTAVIYIIPGDGL